jgi:hypothetical protein
LKINNCERFERKSVIIILLLEGCVNEVLGEFDAEAREWG